MAVLESWREFLKILFYFYLCIFVLWGGVCAFKCMCPQRPEEGIGSPGAGVEGVCELLSVGKAGSLGRAVYPLNLTAEPSDPLKCGGAHTYASVPNMLFKLVWGVTLMTLFPLALE